MRLSLMTAVVVLFAGYAFGVDAEADSLVRSTVSDFMLALKSGDGEVASAKFSVSALNHVEVMLVTVKQNLSQDPEGTMRHLSSVGYTIEPEAAEDWKTEDYLSATLSLPIMSARYKPYEIEIVKVSIDDRNAVVDIIFRTANGVEIPQEIVLSYEDSVWKISSFMGITAFP
jgi:hypothetical protein